MALVFLVTLRIWLYEKKIILLKYFEQIKLLFIKSGEGTPSNLNFVGSNDLHDYTAKSKAMIIGASGSLAFGTLIFLLILPAHFSKEIESRNVQDINYGKGRTLFYLSRMNLPILLYCSLPLACICSSKKLRSSLVNKLKSFFENHE